VATWKASRITSRIGLLKEQVEAIAAGETISEKPLGPNDDIQSLQTAMRVMSIELAESKKRIAENERTRLIQLLASGLAHELRNHLTGAKLALQTCESDTTDHEAIAIATQQMDLAEQQVRRLLTVQTGIANENQPRVLCVDLLRNVVDLVRPMAIHRQVTVDVFPPLDSPSDELAKLARMEIQSGNAVTGALLNLVINAMEAAGPNGQIKIYATPTLSDSRDSCEASTESDAELHRISKVVWKICDNGEGPPTEIAAQLFEPFITSKPEGVGLGLAMCKRVATSLGGNVTWDRSNGWTTFEFCVPAYERQRETPLTSGKSC
jgi:signal transduction histidine kinase